MPDPFDELIEYKVPADLRPGTDKSSKIILQDQNVLDYISKAAIDAPAEVYAPAPTAHQDGTECDIIYVPRNNLYSNFPPIIVEVQQVVNEDFMVRAVQYCINAYRQYKVFPILVIFCTQKISSRSLASKFSAHPKLKYCLQTSSNHFAQDVILLTVDSIEQQLDDQPLSPIVAIANFFCNGTCSLLAMEKWDDQITQELFAILKKKIGDFHVHSQRSTTQIEALCDVCESMAKQFIKISDSVNSNPIRAKKYAAGGQFYCESLKRKYDVMLENHSVTPMDEPEDIMLTEVDLDNATTLPVTDKKSDWKFVYEYKNDNQGRMNWEHCYESGQAKDPPVFLTFTSAASLKAQYYKAHSSRTQ